MLQALELLGVVVNLIPMYIDSLIWDPRNQLKVNYSVILLMGSG